jgi:adenylate cyclase
MINAGDILKGRILIVDDQPANVLLLERMLRGAGYEFISSTTNPRDVCEMHRSEQYELILLDLQMPGMDGFAVMEGLKQIEQDGYLPVLVITAQPDQKLKALRSGARDFISKPFDLAEVLLRVRNMLEVRLLHLATKRLYNQVLTEQKVSERLLLNVLPQAIAERLKGRPEVVADSFKELVVDSFDEVTVLFADIVDFTSFSQTVSAEVLVDVLNDVFTRFDRIADARGLEKIKTIGDAYMAAAGLPIPVADHTNRAAHMALDMIEEMDRFNEQTGHALKIRIGICSGAVVAGVIGRRKFLYDLWGDVVNTASRMESHGVAGRIQVTDSTRQRLNPAFTLEDRGSIEVKGKGEMQTWFLNGRKAESAVPMQVVRVLEGVNRSQAANA